jgi:hypothetical protein
LEDVMAIKDGVLSVDDLRAQLAARQLRQQVVMVAGMGEVLVRELTASEQIEVGGLMAALYQPGMSKTELVTAVTGKGGAMAPAMLLAAAFGLGLGREGVALLERSPEMVNVVAPVVFSLSGLGDEGNVKKNLVE